MGDVFGNRMKSYEGVEAKRRLDPSLPVIARIDGRSFSKFTRGFTRPFDTDLHAAMVHATDQLVDQTHADIGYTQSDEITLVWQNCNIFDARVSKLTSVLAGLATSAFCVCLGYVHPDKVNKYLPHFDARVWNVPSEIEALNAVLWRSQDARKNGVSSAARSHLSAKAMHGLNQVEMIEAMADQGTVYANYPKAHRFGTYLQRRLYTGTIPDHVWAAIPTGKRPDSREITRSRVEKLDIGYFGDVENKHGVVFGKESPRMRTREEVA